MNWIARFYRSSIGSKVVMAVTGLALFGFLVGHLAGNLLIFKGPEAINEYARWLREHPEVTWAARLGLLALFVLHVVTAIRLSRANRAARPERYRFTDNSATTYAGRTMLVSGLVLLAYVLFHLAHYTFGLVQPAIREAYAAHDVYSMVVLGFRNPLISLLYTAAMVLLASHLAHGLSSLLQSLGANHPRYQGLFGKLGPVVGVVLAVGYLSIPAAVLVGVLDLPQGP